MMMETFLFPKEKRLKLKVQDLLLENAKEGNVQFKNGELKVLKKEGQNKGINIVLTSLIYNVACAIRVLID